MTDLHFPCSIPDLPGSKEVSRDTIIRIIHVLVAEFADQHQGAIPSNEWMAIFVND
jgi:hypothetical protein